MSMYGSIHTHFESRYDTANDMTQMCLNFIRSGAKRVAVTEHGVFSSYEDLRDTIAHIRQDIKDGIITDIPEDFELEIIPGIEGYFGKNRAHLILIAKDYEGYLSLCKIISESNENIDSKENPIITEENLAKNVAKGHVICTSACIAGPFGHLLGLDEFNLREKITQLTEALKDSGYEEASALQTEAETLKTKYKEIKPLKKEKDLAERAAKKGNPQALEEYIEREAQATQLLAEIERRSAEFEANEKRLTALRKAGMHTKYIHLKQAEADLDALLSSKRMGIHYAEADRLYHFFEEVFGEEDFYFELQNHGLSQENIVYNELIDFALEEGCTHFIASNDIHVGVRKKDPDYEDALLRRNVIKYTRFKTYSEETEDDREYVIKEDEELREELLKSIQDHEFISTHLSAEEIVDTAIGNIEQALSQCSIEFPKNVSHYPKFCEDENQEFERLVRKGIQERFPNGFPIGHEKEYEERIEYELGVIKTMGYAGYHLIVADYLRYGRLLGYLRTEEEIANAPLNVEELDQYITDRGYERIGYSIGPGRGSGVGSICCYALGITDIDPMPYNLLFERFLNVERVSMPDIDSDFKTDIREKVVEYCKARYGADCICQIMTKSYGAIKGNLRLAARYFAAQRFQQDLESGKVQIKDLLMQATPTEIQTEEVEQEETQEEDQENGYTKTQMNIALKVYSRAWYDRADQLSKQYDELQGNLPEIETLSKEQQEIVHLASLLEGVFTNYGEHAAGTIISGDRLSNIIPLRWNSKKKNVETQCTMAQAEAKGLLKMDFLGLENLDIITEISQNPQIGEPDNTLQDYGKREQVLKDPAIYRDIFATGLTQGVFQFESPGMRRMIQDFRPETFEDLILLVAAYRPGPMQYLPEIIEQKKYDDWMKKKQWMVGKEQPKKPEHTINIDCEALQNILKPTYGCIIYQEQVMQIFQALAGYSLGGADLVRRAMSKKKMSVLEKERKAFLFGDPERGIKGCMEKSGISEEQANRLFDQIMEFAKYAFNKSHATAYAMVAMFTAYQKKYHTADFFRVSLNHVHNLADIPDFVKEMSAFGIQFKGPSLRESQNYFMIEDGGKSIRFGLKYIKGMSEQDIKPHISIEAFMELNPTITETTLKKYIQLGLFEECWKEDVKDRRVHGNRKAQLDWLKNNIKLFTDYKKQLDRIEELQEQLAEAEETLKRTSSQDPELLKGIRKLHNSLKEWIEKSEITKQQLEQHRQEDRSEGRVPEETVKEHLENRKYETDMLSLAFDLQESMKRLEESENQRTFEDLLNPGMDEERHVQIPAIVLSCEGPKKTKSGTSTYYAVSLMDRNHNIITRRFDSEVTVLDGIFRLTTEKCKYWNCSVKSYTPIKARPAPSRYHSQPRTHALPNASAQEKIQMVLQGGSEVQQKGFYMNGKWRTLLSVPTEKYTSDSKDKGICDDEDFER